MEGHGVDEGRAVYYACTCLAVVYQCKELKEHESFH